MRPWPRGFVCGVLVYLSRAMRLQGLANVACQPRMSANGGGGGWAGRGRGEGEKEKQ